MGTKLQTHFFALDHIAKQTNKQKKRNTIYYEKNVHTIVIARV